MQKNYFLYYKVGDTETPANAHKKSSDTVIQQCYLPNAFNQKNKSHLQFIPLVIMTVTIINPQVLGTSSNRGRIEE